EEYSYKKNPTPKINSGFEIEESVGTKTPYPATPSRVPMNPEEEGFESPTNFDRPVDPNVYPRDSTMPSAKPLNDFMVPEAISLWTQEIIDIARFSCRNEYI